MRNFYLPILAVAALTLTGCNDTGPMTDAEEEKVPLVNAGQLHMEQGNTDEAITAFKQAIDENPMIARPHLDLGLIYAQDKINYIHSIYHYDRYLELRPDAEKAQFINDQKLKVAQALANTLINNSPEVKKLIRERNDLIQMNTDLKRQLEKALQAQKAAAQQAPKPTQTVTQTVPKATQTTTAKKTETAKPATQTTKSTSSTSAKHQIYHVVSGDTLSKIARKFYNDPGKWDIIFEANKDSMKSASDLRVGQTLVIPSIGN